MEASFAGQTVIVTGSSKGIGRGIARVFASKGANLLLVSRTEAALVEAVAEMTEIQKTNGGSSSYFVADVSSAAQCDAMAAAAAERFGRIDVLCANAGILPAVSIDDMSEADWDHIFASNAKSSFLCVKAVLPHMRRQKYGRIVLTSSITGPITGFGGWSHYGATKAAQLGFMRTVACEVARDKITINAVLPGNINTEAIAAMGDEYRKSMEACIPMRTLGTVEDIGHAAAFLASREAKFVTGQTLVVDGGQTLPETKEAL
eukprot:TRINITY_DN8246_c0_g1_i1.p1 TRINITY_DN8246_c0_g1~~TRINITY_DN8246_c0_g1_i1.p1  ORF type:complete len:261 (-),score=82.63 TRINITY_DN8246_c0_g1_i1:133-915(-)